MVHQSDDMWNKLICLDVNLGVSLRCPSCTLDGDTMPDSTRSHSSLSNVAARVTAFFQF